ncbi:MAG TPA: MBL fold metallo-hydrolase [Steroidobacteraceae bacterium]|nr:MBL fold metallo-hydrolase [Steroidobacteraceae bacterium]
MNRRRFMRAVPATAFALSTLGASLARAAVPSPAATPAAVELADRLWQITGCGGNVTLFNSPEGVLLVDGGASSHTAALLKEVGRLTGTQRVHTLFNTHWHHDQTGSNLALGKAGTRIIAHEYTRLWLTTDVESRWEDRVYQPLPKVAQPSETFYTTGSLAFGGEQIDYGHLGQAHTDGDIHVFFRKANVLVAGDVVSVGRFPVIDPASNGWLGGMVTAVQTLVGLADAGTRVVPGIGPAQDLTHLKAEETMLEAMRQRLGRLMAQGMSAAEMIAERPATDFEPQWGDPTLFIRNAYPGMAHRARELGVSIV